METGVVYATEFVLIGKDALELPPGILTEAGITAAALLLNRLIAIPPVGAGPFNVTVATAGE